MEKDQWHASNELRDRLGRSLELFYDRIGKHHHGVSGRLAVDFHPPADVNEQDTGVEISLELPGIDRADVDILAGEGWLTVRGQKHAEREEKDLTFFLRERFYGKFERSFTLPKSLVPEKATARLRNGVLTIRVPRKAGSKARAREIPLRK